MNFEIIKIYSIAILLLICIQGVAQNDTLNIALSNVRVLSERSEQSITLRWAPSSPELWLATNRYGYEIQRMEVDTNNFDTELFTTIASMKPNKKSEWEAILEAEELPKYMAVGYECIFGAFESLAMGQGIGAWVAQSDELKHKYSFALFAADMDQRTAEFSALRYKDTSIDKDAIYVYKIVPNIPEEEAINFSDGVVLVNTEINIYPAVVMNVQEKESMVVLRWLREPYYGKYTAYFIERAPKGGSFTKLHEEPYVHGMSRDSLVYNPYMVYMDSVANYQAYDYRITGLTPFGDTGPYSSIYSGMGKDLTPPPSPILKEAINTQGDEVKITWDYTEDSDLAGFDIYRGHQYEDNYYKLNKEMLSVNTRSFVDEAALILDRNYYYVSAIDQAGNRSSSRIIYGIIEDTIPPSPPMGLEGKIDSNGVVSISWHKNPEHDIKGYKVFFANADYHEFSLKTGKHIPQNNFTDTISLKTLTKSIYYRVMAVDRRYNYSKMSEILELKKPDTIPPTSPIFTDYKVEKDAIELSWANSHSNDLAKHVLMRRTGKGDWKIRKEFTDETESYRDKMIENGKFYSYKILAVDDAGLHSRTANALVLEAVDIIMKPGIEKLIVEKANEKNINLNWSYPLKGKYRFVIYRSEEEGGFELLKVLKADKKDFVDTRAHKNKTYKYTVQVEFSDGTHSKFSPIVAVN